MTNAYLIPLANSEAVANEAMAKAFAFANEASRRHAGYAEAFAAIDAASAAWGEVRRLGNKLQSMQGADPAIAEAQNASKMLLALAHVMRANLASFHAELAQDQLLKRPDLGVPPSPGASTSSVLVPLVAIAALVYAFARWVL
jgi:hypothetical protein